MNRHRSLQAWQACHALAVKLYSVTSAFPAHERFGLSSQLRRAAISAGANIAEGYTRFGAKETAHSLSIALGSLAEVDSLVAVAEALEYASKADIAAVEALHRDASRLTFGLQRAIRQRTS